MRSRVEVKLSTFSPYWLSTIVPRNSSPSLPSYPQENTISVNSFDTFCATACGRL